VNQSSLYVFSAAGLFDLLLVHVLPPGGNINPLLARAALAAPDVTTQRLSLVPGDYEITVQDAESLGVVAGPAPVAFAERGLYGVLMLNAADAVTVDLQYFYDVP
jgi:hypothetical protein